MITCQFAHAWLKAHVEHAIGLVEDEELALLEADPVLCDKVFQTTRRAN